jgi:hypothetical protein
LFVNGIGDDGTTCVFSRGCCEVNGTVVKDGSGGLTHLRKYDFLNLVKTNIPLRFKKIMINFYYAIRAYSIYKQYRTVMHTNIKILEKFLINNIFRKNT